MINNIFEKINNDIFELQKKNENNNLEKKNENFNLLKNNNLQKGGNIKEQFELKPLSDFDYDKYKLSNYMNDNINWGKMPGSPPMPTCSIL